MKHLLIALLAFFLLFGCEKKTIVPAQKEEAILESDEPVQRLAQDAARRIQSGLAGTPHPSLQIMEMNNAASLPPEIILYFQTALERFLKNRGFTVSSESKSRLSGQFLQRNNKLVFAFTIQTDSIPVFSDSADIAMDERLENTLAQFKREEAKPPEHVHHAERAIPTPLLEIQQPLLDVSSICNDREPNCHLLLLFPDRLIKRNWQDQSETRVSLPAPASYARAPAGKILIQGNSVVILTSAYVSPLFFDENLKPVSGTLTTPVPLPERSLNSFALADGRFYDFDVIHPNLLVAVTVDYFLNLAEKGALAVSDRMVGSALTSSLPWIYTSSASLPGQADSVLKFAYEQGALHYKSSHPLDGEVIDLAITDLNQDLEKELLITLRTPRGIFIEVTDLF